ncbi:MAG: GntR family transcriptional regulator [Anaeromyxobacter sp.]
MAELPVIAVDLAGPAPAYRQIADAVRAHLVAGRVRAGEQLPTVRRLALDLGVNHNTVAEAYRVLAEEGWLDLGRGRGATVRERAAPAPSADARGRFERRIGELVAEARTSGVTGRQARQALLAAARALGGGRRS